MNAASSRPLMMASPASVPALFDLTGKVAIVTGAARGNGFAIGQGLAGAGASVVLADVLTKELSEAAAAMTAGGYQVLAVPTDICRPAQRKRLVHRAVRKFGRLDILVNCAGITGGGRAEDYDEKKWRQVFEVNTTAAFRLSQLAAQPMIRQKGGAIINITSVAGVLGFPADPAYLASKGALQQLTRALATDWAKHGIRVNNLCLGFFHTAMTEKSWSDPAKRQKRSERCMMKRWGNSEELAGPVVFLASEASSFMTGNDLLIDGGLVRTGFASQD